jgi:hypothetical protein
VFWFVLKVRSPAGGCGCILVRVCNFPGTIRHPLQVLLHYESVFGARNKLFFFCPQIFSVGERLISQMAHSRSRSAGRVFSLSPESVTVTLDGTELSLESSRIENWEEVRTKLSSGISVLVYEPYAELDMYRVEVFI